MPRKPSTTLAFPLVAILGAGMTLLPARPTTPPGPGGVIDTVKDFITALDSGHTKTLAAVLDVQVRGRDGMIVVPDQEKPWGFRQAQTTPSPRFVDVAWDGHTIAESDRKQFLHHVHSDIARTKVAGRGMASKIISIRADCPSADVSYAIVEFERSYTVAGKSQGTQRFIATALLRHVEKKASTSAPDFRIFHLHATRVTPRPALKKG